jgi:hypothetical protein
VVKRSWLPAVCLLWSCLAPVGQAHDAGVADAGRGSVDAGSQADGGSRHVGEGDEHPCQLAVDCDDEPDPLPDCAQTTSACVDGMCVRACTPGHLTCTSALSPLTCLACISPDATPFDTCADGVCAPLVCGSVLTVVSGADCAAASSWGVAGSQGCVAGLQNGGFVFAYAPGRYVGRFGDLDTCLGEAVTDGGIAWSCPDGCAFSVVGCQ